jgi:hypothetical protein
MTLLLHENIYIRTRTVVLYVLCTKRLKFFFAPLMLVYTHRGHKKIGTVIIIYTVATVITTYRLSTLKHPLTEKKTELMRYNAYDIIHELCIP